MYNNSWDIFSTRACPGSLWFAYHAAKSLVERRQTARLFTDQVTELCTSLHSLDPTLWSQMHSGVEILDHRLAPHTAPGSHLMQFFGAEVQGAYVTRFASQPGRAGWVQVERFDSPPRTPGPLHLVESATSYRRFSATLGDLPRHAGYVRQRHHTLAMRQRWGERKARLSLLNLLGLPSDTLDGKLVAYVAGDQQVKLDGWLRMFAAQRPRTCIFLQQGPAQDAAARLVNLQAQVPTCATHGSATLVFLPALQWFVLDELISVSDATLTNLPDIAMRAAECGAPLIWGGEPAGQDHELLNWYLSDAPQPIRNALADAFSALRTGQHIGQAWQWYINAHLDIGRHAGGVSARIQRNPNLIDVLIAGMDQDDHQPLAEQFSPTQPHSLAEATSDSRPH